MEEGRAWVVALDVGATHVSGGLASITGKAWSIQ